MKCKIIGLISGAFVLISALNNRAFGAKHSCADIANADLDIVTYKIEGFENSEIQQNKSFITVKASNPLAKYVDIEKMSGEDFKNVQSKRVELTVKSISDIGLMSVDYKIFDLDNEEVFLEDSTYAYAYVREDTNEKDVAIEFGTETISARDIVNKDISVIITDYGNLKDSDLVDFGGNNTTIKDPHTMVETGGGSSNTLTGFFDIPELLLSLANYENASTIASRLMGELDLITALTSGDITNLFFSEIRKQIAFSNYEHNIKLDVDIEGYINDQGNKEKFGNYKVGPFGNIHNNGCGVIATYNALYASGTQVDFASLVALFDLCGCDLMFNKLGINPSSNELPTLAEELYLSFKELFIDPVYNKIFGLNTYLICLGIDTAMCLPIAGPNVTALFSSQITVDILLNSLVDTVKGYCIWRAGHSLGLNELLIEFYQCNQVNSYHGENEFSSFQEDFKKMKLAIICSWNDSPDKEFDFYYGSGAHYIFVYHDIENKEYLGYNVYSNSTEPAIAKEGEYNEYGDFIGDGRENFYKSFIYGWTLHDVQ